MNEDFKAQVESYKKYLALNQSISMPEAEKRAGEFLAAQAIITEFRHILSEEKIKLTTLQSVRYAEELSKCTGKTVTENKVTVEACRAYTVAREDLERIENDLAYLKAYYDVYANAHIFYRMMCKTEFL